MRYLIDGYNLMHVTDLFGAGELEGTLRGSRESLLSYIASRLSKRERQATLIVFDSAQAPPGLPDEQTFEEIQVRFSRGYADADTLIEELLEDATATKQLTVVSGDRRVQRAARSNGAKPIDSKLWFKELQQRPQAGESVLDKPSGSVESNAHWIQAFSDADTIEQLSKQQKEVEAEQARNIKQPPSRRRPEDQPETKSDSASTDKQSPAKKPTQSKKPFGEGILNPFPPGYGEDLLE